MLSAKWHKGVSQNAPQVELTGDVSAGEHKRRLGTNVKERLPRRIPNHHQLEPYRYKPGTFAGSWNLASSKMTCCQWPLSGSATSVSTPSGDGGGWQLTGASLWVYRHGNHGTRAGCGWFSDQPSFHANFSSPPSRPEHF